MKSLLLSFFLLLLSRVNAQQPLSISLNTEFSEQLGVSYFNAVNDFYQVNIIDFTQKNFSIKMNFRMEDELTSNVGYSLLDDITFLDVSFNYRLGSFDFGIVLDNLLNVNDQEFTVEPNSDNEIINHVYFTYESNFLISTRIVYHF